MLKNRFPQEVFAEWVFHYTCWICGQNTADALHHIISPSSEHFVGGDYNKSVLNSAPICNHKCHLYNPNLHKMTKELLKKTYEELQRNGYKLKDIDIEFLRVYEDLYD